jgi:hypothetical protein
MRARRNSYAIEAAKASFEGKPVAAFDPLGGDGYNRKREPNPECPECFGDGVNVLFYHDTRKLTPGAKAVYAGVKEGKEGVEVKVHSKERALEMLGKHLGMFVEKKEISGPGGGPIQHTIDVANMSDEELEKELAQLERLEQDTERT